VTAPPLLAALAAAFLPSTAAAVLARHPEPALPREAARLAVLPRPERLAALAEALAARPRPSRAAREDAAARERPRLAAALRAGEEADPLSPLLARLLLERGWSRPGAPPDAARTPVRAASASLPSAPASRGLSARHGD
jgi:hypothetical protein